MARVELRPEEPNCTFISDHVFSTSFEETFTNHWHTFQDLKDETLEITHSPFRICRISNFLKSKELMEHVKNELLDIKFRRNVIDLYQFEQTGDLTVATKRHIKMLHKSLQKDMRLWMERNTNITLNGKVSMSSSSYYDTDHLLCHDDNLDDRRIAFILYLMDEWSAEDGGALDLFDTDIYGLPRNVVKSLVPEYNSLVFFEVLDNSFHQVAEVTSHEKCRWSINGWFHGSVRKCFKPVRPFDVDLIEPNSKEIQLNSWISKTYLSSDNIKMIQEQVEMNSYSFLRSFLNQDVYEKLLIDLTSENISWKMVGPADERHYEIADEHSLPQLLKDFYNLFKSVSLFQLLKDYTELDLVSMNEFMAPKMTIELQRWSAGCYTLISGIYSDETIDFTKENKLRKRCVNVNQSDNVNLNDVDPYDEIDPYYIDQYDDVNQYGDVDRGNEEHGITSNDLISDTEEIEYSQVQLDHVDNEKTASSQTTPSNVVPRQEDLLLDLSEICQHVVSKNFKRKFSLSPQSSPSKSEVPSKMAKKDYSNCNLEETLSDESSSDIDDYLSHSSDESSNVQRGGALDLIMQFHTHNTLDLNETIDYVDPKEPGGELIHVPAKENHLCLVYKTSKICRLHRYVNHYCRGYFYNLICTYYE